MDKGYKTILCLFVIIMISMILYTLTCLILASVLFSLIITIIWFLILTTINIVVYITEDVYNKDWRTIIRKLKIDKDFVIVLIIIALSFLAGFIAYLWSDYVMGTIIGFIILVSLTFFCIALSEVAKENA